MVPDGAEEVGWDKGVRMEGAEEPGGEMRSRPWAPGPFVAFLYRYAWTSGPRTPRAWRPAPAGEPGQAHAQHRARESAARAGPGSELLERLAVRGLRVGVARSSGLS